MGQSSLGLMIREGLREVISKLINLKRLKVHSCLCTQSQTHYETGLGALKMHLSENGIEEQ